MQALAARICLIASVTLFALPLPSAAWDRGNVARFATLPDGAAAPEGIEVDEDGNVYVASFGSPSGAGVLFVFDRHGRLVRRVAVPGSSASPLALSFHPVTGELLLVDFGGARVLAVDPLTGSSTVFMTLPDPAGAGLNDITFDGDGNAYVSDSFLGVVWKRAPGPDTTATAWVNDPLLRTSGVPPFGANGLRFDPGGAALFVANTGNDTVVRIPVADGGAAGVPAVFANSINGADGLLVDEDGNVWVAANQADEIVVLDPTGRAVAKLGDFDGIARDGAPEGLLFPASLRFSGKDLLVTNLSLDLRGFSPTFSTPDSAWAAEVTRHTIARISLRR